jgi:spermidine/putrescine transport system substrate-binding protein
VSVLTEMPDTMGLVLLSDGTNPTKFTDQEWQRAIEKLRKARVDGQIRAFTGNEYINDLSAGNLKASVAWSGDIAASGDKNLVFVTPEEGAMIWSDNMMVPNMAQHQLNAEEWINYYYQPEVAARLAAYTTYICPVQGAQEAMGKIDKTLVDNQLIFPSEETLKRTHAFMTLQEYKERDYKGDFNDVQGG